MLRVLVDRLVSCEKQNHEHLGEFGIVSDGNDLGAELTNSLLDGA